MWLSCQRWIRSLGCLLAPDNVRAGGERCDWVPVSVTRALKMTRSTVMSTSLGLGSTYLHLLTAGLVAGIRLASCRQSRVTGP